jgi:hypothetical protein
MYIASLASKRMLAKMLSDKFILLLFSRAAAPIWANENFTPLTAFAVGAPDITRVGGLMFFDSKRHHK